MMPLRPVHPHRESKDLAMGIACAGLVALAEVTGHPRIAEAIMASAAPFLIKPSADMLNRLDFESPAARLATLLTLWGSGFVVQHGHWKHHHLPGGTVINALTGIYAAHLVPTESIMKAARPVMDALTELVRPYEMTTLGRFLD